jgi:hypothetical protein
MSAEVELLELSKKLLNSIDSGDWATYASMCDATITCFEPEALGHLVEGLPFHKFYFDLPATATKPAKQSSIASSRVRLMGDSAVVTYVRVVQKLDSAVGPVTVAAMETRIWQKTPAGWKHVHFHRTPC